MTGRRDLHCGENCTSYCYQKLADCSLQLNRASGTQNSENFHKRYGSEKTKWKANFLFSLLRPPLNLLLSLGVVWVRLLPYYSTAALDPQKTNWRLAKQIHSSCNEKNRPFLWNRFYCSAQWRGIRALLARHVAVEHYGTTTAHGYRCTILNKAEPEMCNCGLLYTPCSYTVQLRLVVHPL
jgi:hypothetical protein